VTESEKLSETLQQWESGRRRRGADCLSDRALDGVLTGEVRDAALASARTHLAGCPACAGALQALTEDRQRFLAESNLGALAADALARATAGATARPWRRRLVPAFALGAAAAAALLFAPRLRQQEEFRAKGAAGEPPAALALALYVKHVEQPDGNLGEPHWGEPLHAGDQIRITMDNDQPGSLTVLAVDATGQIAVYQPAMPLSVGRALALPQAIELDGTLGDEVIVALRCPANMATQAVVKAAERALDQAMVGKDPAAALGKLGLPCAEVRYAFQKVAR
jgi:hypothetical protein